MSHTRHTKGYAYVPLGGVVCEFTLLAGYDRKHHCSRVASTIQRIGGPQKRIGVSPLWPVVLLGRASTVRPRSPRAPDILIYYMSTFLVPHIAGLIAPRQTNQPQRAIDEGVGSCCKSNPGVGKGQLKFVPPNFTIPALPMCVHPLQIVATVDMLGVDSIDTFCWVFLLDIEEYIIQTFKHFCEISGTK